MNDKNFHELISTRHSVRSFQNSEISEDKINFILEASTKGPSSGNLQSYQIMITFSKSKKEQLTEAAHGQQYIREAPFVMIFCADPKKSQEEYGARGKELFCIQDATIACTYSQLAAHSLGLSSVWIGSFDENKISKILNLDNEVKPIAILPIGFANESPEITSRKPLEEIIHKI